MNPGDDNHNPGQIKADEKFNTLPGPKGAEGKEGGKGGVAQKGLKAAENANEWATDVKKTAKAAKAIGTMVATEGAGAVNPQNIKDALGFLGVLKRRAPAIIIGLLVLVSGAIGLVVAGILAPILLLDSMMDDLNDQFAALDIRNILMLDNKATTSGSKGLASCNTSTESIRCRSATMSKTQVDRLSKSGIVVTGDKVGERVVPKNYTFREKDYTSDEFSIAVKNDSDLRLAYKEAFNMRVLGFSDKNFVSNTLGRYGGSKAGPELKGTHEEKVKQLMNRQDNDGAPIEAKKFVPKETNDDGTPKEGTTYTIEGDSSGEEYTQAEVDAIQATAGQVAGANTQPSRLGDLAVSSVSAFGYWDLACSVKSKIGAASVATKVANQRAAAGYAMNISSLVYKAKAGEATLEETTAISEFFSKTDNRKKITAPEKAFENSTAGSDNVFTPSNSDVMVDNPNYGKTALDSPLIKMTLLGGSSPKRTSSEKQYAVGVGQKTILQGVDAEDDTIAAINAATGPDDSLCDFVQSPLGKGLGLLAGLPLSIAGGAGTLAIKAPVFISMYGTMLMLDNIINSSLANTVVPTDTDKSPVDAGSLLWTGLSALIAPTSQSRGMVAGNSAEIVAYQKASVQSKEDYIAIERKNTTPFDTTSRYSFLGALILKLSTMTHSSVSVSTALRNVGAVVSGGFASLLSPAVSRAEVIDPSRYEHCDDAGYQSVGINADVQCNVRFIMSDDDLAMDTDPVQEAMETNACNGQPCVAEDTTTGLPGSYYGRDAAEIQKYADDFIAGRPNDMYSSVDYENDYAKFLDFCAYRALPLGESYGLTNVEEDWQTGKLCRAEGAPYNYFRVYTLDVSTLEMIDTVYDYNSASATANVGRPDGAVDYGNGWALKPGVDYSQYPCDPRTEDKGVYDVVYKIRVCNTKIDGILTDVASVVSTNFMNMYEAAKADGITFFMAEGLRRNNSPYYSAQSRHSMGVAFDLGSKENGNSSFCYIAGGDVGIARACRSRQDAAGKAVRWLDEHAKEYGFQNLNGEAWHWSTGEYAHEFNQK